MVPHIDEQGGTTANRHGKQLEQMVETILLGRGYRKLSQKEKSQQAKALFIDSLFNDPWFSPQMKLELNLYGAEFTSDFAVYHPEKYPKGILMECKWQGSGGSVDEKYVFTVLSINKFAGFKILILGGEGARKKAKLWIADQAKKKKDFEFFDSMDAFTQWANYNL